MKILQCQIFSHVFVLSRIFQLYFSVNFNRNLQTELNCKLEDRMCFTADSGSLQTFA